MLEGKRMRRRNVGVFCCLLCLVLACFTMMFGCGKAKQEEQQNATDQKTEKTDEPEETGDDVATLLKNTKYVAVIHVKINPEFNIYLDEDENVVALECLNADAKDAYGKKSFAGKSLDETLQTDRGFYCSRKRLHERRPDGSTYYHRMYDRFERYRVTDKNGSYGNGSGKGTGYHSYDSDGYE